MYNNKSAYQDSDPISSALGILLIILIIMGWLFFSYFVEITCTILHSLWFFLYLCIPPLKTIAAPHINFLAQMHINAKNTSFNDWFLAMNEHGIILFIIFIPLTIFAVYTSVTHPSCKVNIKLNVITLPHKLAKFCFSIIPVLFYGDKKTQLLHDDSKEHKAALTPEEFAEKYKLIERKELNKELTEYVFKKQLGRKLENFESLVCYEKALFTIFGLQVFIGTKKARTIAENILDYLNISCMKNKKNLGYPLFNNPNIDKYFNQIIKTTDAKKWLETHQFIRTGLVGLYSLDLRFPSARFRWLKGLDRTLWYSLHSANVPKVFVEGAGVISMSRFEVYLKQNDIKNSVIYVDSAVIGLEKDLRNLHLLHELEESFDFQINENNHEDSEPGQNDDDDYYSYITESPILKENKFEEKKEDFFSPFDRGMK